MNSQPEIYTVKQLAEKLEISERFIWRLIAEGRLTCTRIGNKTVRITGDQLEAFLQSAAS